MRGLTGLLIAAGLGLAGALCNWLYLDSLARSESRLAFIGVKPDVQLNIGDIIRLDQLEPVEIPRSRSGNLNDVAPLWSAHASVVGLRAIKPYSGGELILRQDLETPSQKNLAELLAEDEVARWVPIDPRAVIPEQINPGDLVSFETPQVVASAVSPAVSDVGAPPAPRNVASAANAPQGPREVIGPFRVLAIGARRDRPNIQQARGRVGAPENTITIAVRLADGKMESRAVKLFDSVRAAGSQGVYVLLHSAKGN